MNDKDPLKDPKSIDEQLDLLKKRGMKLDDETARYYLENIGYYRLSGYWFMWQDKAHGSVYRIGTSFDHIVDVYEFDWRLKSILFDYIGVIEIRMRNQLAYYMAMSLGADSHLGQDNFSNSEQHTRFLLEYNSEIERQLNKTAFVKHNINKYGQIPIWGAVELLSLTALSKMYGNLKSNQLKNDIAKEFNLRWLKLKNWLEILSFIRNACAHHQRLYGRRLPYKTKLFSGDPGYGPDSIFSVLMILKHLFNSYDPEIWDSLIKRLCSSMALAKSIDITRLGFPQDWDTKLRPRE